MIKKYLISEKKYNELTSKRNDLEKITLPKIREEKRYSIDTGGGTHDNASYESLLIVEDVTNKQIADLNAVLGNFIIIDYNDINCDEVRAGTKVHIHDLDTNKKIIYIIAGAFETVISENKIAYDTPIGKQLLGMKTNERRQIKLPNGTTKHYMVEKIEKINND